MISPYNDCSGVELNFTMEVSLVATLAIVIHMVMSMSISEVVTIIGGVARVEGRLPSHQCCDRQMEVVSKTHDGR